MKKEKNISHISDSLIEEALLELDDFLRICNPIELGIFKIKIGKKVDDFYKQRMIDIVSKVLNKNNE